MSNPIDPDELGTYLKKSAKHRLHIDRWAKLGAAIGTIALVLAIAAILIQQGNLLEACERAHTRDREIAHLALAEGALETHEAASARADTDCSAQFSLIP